MTELHATSPLNAEYTLCGVAFNVDAIEAGTAPLFALPGERVNCPHCRVVVNYCKAFKGQYRTPESRESNG